MATKKSSEETVVDETPLFDVSVIIHMVDRESQRVDYKQVKAEEIDEIAATVVATYETVKKNNSMTLVVPDGSIYIFNVDNITCVEIRR